MSFVFQIAGKARLGRAHEIRQALGQFEPVLRRQSGFERAKLLVNYSTLQVELLFYWKSYEQGLAFDQGERVHLGALLLPLMESQGTLVTSVVECELAGGSMGA